MSLLTSSLEIIKKPNKLGVLLVNLGTPAAPTTAAVKAYLQEFLSDPYVVRLPQILWQPLLRTIILPLRSKRVAKNYQVIWTAQGSPLRVITAQIASELQKTLNIPVAIAMRYGEPSIKEGIKLLQQQEVDEYIILPLFPQYSTATTASIVDKIEQMNLSKVKCISDYYNDPAYINLLATQVQQYRQIHGESQRLLIAFHGLPKKFILDGDPYEQQCVTTARLLAQALALKSEQWQLCYQSRFGKAAWLQPYMIDVLNTLPREGITSVDIISPGFAADCLETLEELAIQNQRIFMQAGGQTYHYIPALNAQAGHISCLANIVNRAIGSANV